MKKQNFKLIKIAVLVIAVFSALTLNVFASEVPTYVTVAQPVTNIVGDISAVRTVNDADELAELTSAEMLPATAIFLADENLNVKTDEGVAYSTVSEVISAMEYKVIPAFRVESKAAAEAVGTWLNENFADAFLISTDFEVLEAGRAKGTLVTGVLDYTKAYASKTTLTDEDLLSLRREVFKREAYAVMLPAQLCTGDTVQKIYDYRIGVWARISDTPDAAELFGAVVSGAIGVVTDDTAGVIETGLSLDENTVTRAPKNVSHAGKQNDAPANTLQAIINAYEYGAVGVEFDIYLCAPEEGEELGSLVLNHDAATSETWSEDGTTYKISETPWSVLSTLKIPYDDTTYSMSLFEDVCKYFAGTDDGIRKSDISLVLDIKDTTQEYVPYLVMEMLEEYGLLDQCYVSSFSTTFANNIDAIYDSMPTNVSKNPGVIEDATADKDMQRVRELSAITNSFLGVSISGVNDVVTEISARAGLHRGILLGVWGTTTAKMPLYFLEGYSNLSNDYIRNLGNYTRGIEIAGIENGINVTSGDIVDISAIRSSYRYGEEEITDFTVEFIEGEELVTLDETTLTFGDINGKVSFFIKYTHDIAAREGYYEAMAYTVYSDPVTVEISNFNGAVKTDGFSIRLKNYNGLRAIFSFDENKNKFFEEQGYTLLEYGAVAVSEKRFIADGSAVTIDPETHELTSGGIKIAVGKDGNFVGKILGRKNGIVSYCLAVVNYTENHGDNVYFCAYSIYKDPNGETVITLKDYGSPDYNAVNLYQLTLDMYINGAINASNTDEAAVWNTLLTGAVTLTESDYVADGAYMADGATKYSGDFLFSEIPLILKGKISSTIDLTLVNNPSDDSWVVIYRGEGEIVSSYDYRSRVQIDSSYTSDTVCPNPKLTLSSEKKIKTVIYDHGLTKIGSYTLYQHEGVRTVVYPTSLVSFESGTFNYTYNLNTVYEARATGAMQNNAEGIIDVSDVNITSTNAFLRQCRGGKGIHLPGNITAIEGSFHRDSSTNSQFVKIWCGESDEPEEGIIDLTGATALKSIGNYSLQYMPKVTVMKLPDSCTSIGTGVFHNDGKTTKITTPIAEIWQATYNEDIAAYCEENGITYCTLKGETHIDPLSVPGDMEVDDSAIFPQ